MIAVNPLTTEAIDLRWQLIGSLRSVYDGRLGRTGIDLIDTLHRIGAENLQVLAVDDGHTALRPILTTVVCVPSHGYHTTHFLAQAV